jgi:hypothetical protein
MKYLLTLLLCFFASNAFASSADSGKCPWKIPFTIYVDGTGADNHYEYSRIPEVGGYMEHDTSYILQSSGYNFEITVDTTFSYLSDSVQYSLDRDVLSFSVTVGWGNGESTYHKATTVAIKFEPGRDSILSLLVSQNDSISINGNEVTQIDNVKFQISSLLFDDTSIFSADSSFRRHNISMTDNYVDNFYSTMNNYIDNDDYLTASSVTLSGLFRLTTFSNPPSIVTAAPPPNNLPIYSSNGSIACSFDGSDHARNLEIFSPLGVRETSFCIPAGQTEASLPHLPAGFYFVRLDGSMAKVYIAE